MDETKLAAAYDVAIVTWQREGFEGKPPLKLMLQALLDGAADDILFDHDQSLKLKKGPLASSTG